jgi:hypothetical protein
MNLSDRDKRILKIAGPVLGGILVLFLLFNLFTGGGEPVAMPGPVLPPSSPLPSSTASGSASPSPSPVVVFAGRDPFSIPAGLSPSAVVTSGTTTSTSPGGSTSTSPGSTSTSPGATTTSPGGGGNGQDFTGRSIVLIDVFQRGGADMVQVTVNDRPFTVSEGERFSQVFELVSVNGSCANFLHGDESFTLCTNSPK